jgi:hypothetical protein
VGTDGVRAADGGLMRRIVLLAVLVALLVPTATTATTTAPAPNDAVAMLQQSGGPFTGAACDGLERDGSDMAVRVVKKVRGVFLPHGLVPPTFGPADASARHEVLPAYVPGPHAAVPTHIYPRRGPPATGAHPSP